MSGFDRHRHSSVSEKHRYGDHKDIQSFSEYEFIIIDF